MAAATASDNSLSKADLVESNQVLLVVDRGLLYFAKFVLGVVAVVIALGTVFFGFDMNKAREDVNQMQKDVQKAQKDVQDAVKAVHDAQASVEDTKSSVVKIGEEAKRRLEEVRSKTDELLDSAQREAGQIHAYALSAGATLVVQSKPSNSAKPPKELTNLQIASLYHFPTELNGTGQAVGFVELGGGYHETELNAYFAGLNLRPPNIVAVSVDNSGNEPTGDPNGVDSVVMNHIEMMGALAPGANIVIYFAPNTNKGFTDAIRTARQDTSHKPSVLVIDWGAPESSFTTSERAALNAELEAAARRNITVVTSAGNSGVSDGVNDGRPHVDFPGSSQWVIAVGRTRLVANGTEIESEKVWNDGTRGGATGGGVSDVFALPDWQRDAGVPARRDGSHGRGMPDVSAGGSAVALWAGLIVRLNQGLGRNLGYINPKLYREIGPAGILNGITDGDNGNGTLPGFKAGVGWSAVAGWGTPDGRKLLMWLREHPD